MKLQKLFKTSLLAAVLLGLSLSAAYAQDTTPGATTPATTPAADVTVDNDVDRGFDDWGLLGLLGLLGLAGLRRPTGTVKSYDTPAGRR